MSYTEIMTIVRDDATAFDTNPVTYLLAEAASARRAGDYHTAKQAICQAAHFNDLGEGPTLP